MFASRVAARASKSAQRVFRRNMSSGAGFDSHYIPDQGFAVRTIASGLGLGLVFGLGWKSWQWNNQAQRIEANKKWDKYYPIWAAQVKADLAAAAAAEEPAAEEEESA